MKFKKRLLIDVVTGVTLCGIFVAAGYAVLSPQFTSFSTPTTEAILCGTNDCNTTPPGTGTAGAGESCACNPGMIMGSPPNETCMLPMQDVNKCKPGFSCQINPDGSVGGFTCVDPCAGYDDPLCSSSMYAADAGHGEQCVFYCVTPAVTTCTRTPLFSHCTDPKDTCNLNGSEKCQSPCDTFPDVPYCEGSYISMNIPEGEQCVFNCKSVDGASCRTTDMPGGCDQTDKPLVCDFAGSRTCEDPCADFPGGLCEDIDLSPVGEGETCMFTCNEYNGTTCNSNGSRSVPCNSPNLMCNPTSRTCEPMCNGMPGSCSSSSSSSAPQCCNLETQECEDI